MRFVHAIVRLKPEQVALYAKVCMELRGLVLENEPGCPIFELAPDPQDPNVYHVFEAYKDMAAIQAHIAKDYYKRTARILVECMEGDHMVEIDRQGLTGNAMYGLINSVTMNRYETLEG